jgi:hypothetical protein
VSDGVKEAGMKFSRSIGLEKSLIKKDVDDYDNIIYGVAKMSDANELQLTFDYQSFYKPFLPSASSIEYKSFISRANKHCTEKFLRWVNNYFVEG